MLVAAGATFVEGAGTTTGSPILVEGTLDLTGTGASSFDVSSGTIAGDVAAGQVVTLAGTDTATSSPFDNAGTILPARATLDLPPDGTLVNDGTVGLNGNLTLNGGLTNDADGLLDLDGSQIVAGTSGTAVDNQGELDMLSGSSIVLGSGVAFASSGDLEFGFTGGSWGGFGLHAEIQADGPPPASVVIGGSIEPVFPQGNPPSDVTLPPQWAPGDGSTIAYTVAQAPGVTTPSSEDIQCAAAAGSGFSISCTTLGGLDAIAMDDVAPGLVPTQVTIGSSAPLSTSVCGSSCPTSSYGTPVTLTATVAPEYGTTAPTGTVTFFDGPVVLGSGALSTTGGVTTATLTTSSLPPETHELEALYTGDGNDIAGNSSPLEEAVTRQPTSVSLAPVPGSSAFGRPVTLTATVTPGISGPASPTGEVLFYSRSFLIGAGSVSTAAGVSSAAITTTGLPVGAPDSVTAQYGGDPSYAAATSAPATPSVAAPSAPTTVSVAGAASADPATAYDAAASADGSLPTLFALASQPPPSPGLTIDPASGSISYTVPASGVTSFSYAVVAVNPAGRAESGTVTVAVPTPQTIAFPAPASGAVNGSAALAPTASSGLAVTLTVDAATSPSGACTLSADVVGFVHTGTCVLDANQAGGSGYLAAPEVQRSIAVTPAPQTIAFTAPAAGTVNGSALLAPTSTSGLAVTLAVDTSTTNHACTLSGDTVSYVHGGSCVLDATQAGDGDYQAATPVEQTIAVGPATQTVGFTTAARATATVGGATYAPAAHASSGLSVTIALDASSTGCALAAGVVSFTAAGTCVIDATQGGNGDYLPAAPATQTIPVTGTALPPPASVEALTLADVQGSAQYRALGAFQRAALTAAVNALTSVLTPVGPHLAPPVDAALIGIYKLEVMVLRSAGWLTAAQAATLTAEASGL